MKKVLAFIIALGCTVAANAEIYKITQFTKAQERQIESEMSDSGDLMVISTNKGALYYHVDSPEKVVTRLMNAKKGECYDIVADQGTPIILKANKVKCPK